MRLELVKIAAAIFCLAFFACGSQSNTTNVTFWCMEQNGKSIPEVILTINGKQWPPADQDGKCLVPVEIDKDIYELEISAGKPGYRLLDPVRVVLTRAEHLQYALTFEPVRETGGTATITIDTFTYGSFSHSVVAPPVPGGSQRQYRRTIEISPTQQFVVLAVPSKPNGRMRLQGLESGGAYLLRCNFQNRTYSLFKAAGGGSASIFTDRSFD